MAATDGEAFKGGVHLIAASLAAVMGAYNLLRWAEDRDARHLAHAAFYAALWGWEATRVFHHAGKGHHADDLDCAGATHRRPGDAGPRAPGQADILHQP